MSRASAPHIAVVDYGMGNRRSVEKALQRVGSPPAITGEPDALRRANALVLPGVGAFPEAMRRLRERRLDEVLVQRARAGVPLLGICLGMQLLFDGSTEHEGATGLGLLAGDVRRLEPGGAKLPHIGWNRVSFTRASPLTEGLGAAAAFYHVHSFVVDAADDGDVVATGEYGERFASIVARANVFGAQFHPEKSSRDGLQLLANFAGVRAAAHAASA